MRLETRYFEHEGEVPAAGLTHYVGSTAFVVPIVRNAWGQGQDDYSRVAVRRLEGTAFQALEYSGGTQQAWIFAELLRWPPLQFAPLRIEGPHRRHFSISVNLIGIAHSRLVAIVGRSSLGDQLHCASSDNSRHSRLGIDVMAQKRALLQTLAELQPILVGLNRLALANRQMQRRLVVFAAETVPNLLNQEVPVD